ncbi:putative delta-60 repeat protein [Pseudomonas sp. Y3 TE3536]
MSTTRKQNVLDPDYGTYGVARPHRSIQRIASSIPDGDGRICVGTGMDGDYVLFRVDNKGKLDKQFGQTDGLTKGKFAPPLSAAGSSVHLLSDGKILMIGMHNGLQPALARFSSSGFLDKSFGKDGHVLIKAPTDLEVHEQKHVSSTPRVIEVAEGPPQVQTLAANDKVYLTFQFNNSHSTIMRFNADGALDTSFNGTGYKQLTPPRGYLTYTTAMLLDGEFILLGGSVMTADRDLACVIRLHSSGDYDSTFGNEGFAFAELTSDANFFSIAKLASNAIVCAGGEVPQKSVIAAFDNQGQPLSGFITTSLGTRGYWKTVAVFHDQAIITVGDTSGSQADLLVGRFSPDGLPDSGFQENGWLSFSLGKSMDMVSSSELQPDGSTLVTGEDDEEEEQGWTRKGFLLRCLTAP